MKRNVLPSSRRAQAAVMGIVVTTALAFAPPAYGHAGHGSCAAGVESFTVPFAQSGQLGQLASALGRQGQVGATSAELHEQCEPRP